MQHNSAQTAASTLNALPARSVIDVPSSNLRDHEYCDMESVAKRKATAGAAGESEGRPLKRQKVPVRPNLARWYGEGAALALPEWTLDGGTRLSHCGMRDAGWGMGWWQTRFDERPGSLRPPLHGAATPPPCISIQLASRVLQLSEPSC